MVDVTCFNWSADTSTPCCPIDDAEECVVEAKQDGPVKLKQPPGPKSHNNFRTIYIYFFGGGRFLLKVLIKPIFGQV